MIAGVTSRNAVVAVGVPKLLEILVCLNQCLRILEGVLWMNIVICQTMADKQGAMLLVGTLDWVYLVAILVLLRSTHVTLGIDGIIEAVAGRRRNSHTSLEHRATFAHTHQGIETTIAPSHADGAPDLGIYSEDSFQLKEYLEKIGEPKRTCIVIFDRNFKKAEKKWTKLHDRYTKQAKPKRQKNGEKPKDLPTPWQMKNIDESKFMFKAVEPSDMEEPKTKAERKAEKKEAKAQLKQKKAEVKSQLKQRKAEVKQKKAEAKKLNAEAKKKS
nr:unnamed protein product [uncultured bacterium]